MARKFRKDSPIVAISGRACMMEVGQVYLHGKREEERHSSVSTLSFQRRGSLGVAFVPVVIFLVIVVFLFVVFFVRLFPEEKAGGLQAMGWVSVKVVWIFSVHASWYASPRLGNDGLVRLL